MPDDLPPHVETAVYFVVAEALTNIAKHSGAQRAALAVVVCRRVARGRRPDDGRRRCPPGKGAGLAGLQQRLAGVDGTLEVESPEGGPTIAAGRDPGG